ncbi:hypothetical protein JAAARDRAFT_67869 [Jaapia argillacea MUCL 33604]|uniref:Scavenger mRNA decapping enzyme n=1 Tax=Jaapia argillacea MUCL 33604 TaxID=933084 RepID=A0A067PZZ6_9AGAM|nr:hypothetical protein JAAARDRAFT_67869 [Jaapia argillacea MUCL 33604]
MANLLKDLESLRKFKLHRILNEDPSTHALTLLGSFDAEDKEGSEPTLSILRIEKTPLSAGDADRLVPSLANVRFIENNDIYTWLFGWLEASSEKPDVKINIISPATDIHIRKYSAQRLIVVNETPELYERIVKPYIAAFPPSRTRWVTDILTGKTEAEKVLFKDDCPDYGYLILPDMKWDLTTVSSLYLVAIAFSSNIRSLRDLRKRHLGMLRSIKREAARVVKERWGVGRGGLRLFVHYQPSYYHFHVHIVNANYAGSMGMTVGQAHLLDDIISLLEVDGEGDGRTILEGMTLTYGLGDQHGLFTAMEGAQDELRE